ncbi:hypothetical protein D3C79_587780 [compost metagenome]
MIDATCVLDQPIVLITGKVPGAVHPAAALLIERIRNEAFGRQPRAAEITPCQPSTGHVQLTVYPYRYRRYGLTQQINRTVGNRPADVRPAIGATQGKGGVGGVLGGAVQVINLLHMPGRIQLVDQRLLQRLSSKVDGAHGRRQFAGLKQHLDRRWHGVDQTHPVFGRQVRQLEGVGSEHRVASSRQRDEQLPHRQVETDRSRCQHTTQVLLAIDRQRPANQRRYVAMLDQHALGFARGPGGVDAVGQIARFGHADRIGYRVALQRQLIEQQGPGMKRFRHARKQVRLGQQQDRLAVLKHVLDTVLRVLRVERQIGATRLQDRQQANHHFQAALHGDAHQHIRPHPLLAKSVCQLVGPLIQRRIAQHLLAEQQCRRIG